MMLRWKLYWPVSLEADHTKTSLLRICDTSLCVNPNEKKIIKMCVIF